ncbi:MAG TPA: gamma-glutamyl-phosphate reductase, partial [Rhizobiales bacterium]|nr:gamma-glutamyl-phosphate reductase [Hyphomicrobiales bacterium]
MTTQTDISRLMTGMGKQARKAAQVLALASTEQKNAALEAMAANIRRSVSGILAANETDLNAAKARGTSGAFLDRLRLDEARLEAVAASLEDIAALADPVGDVMASWTRPNGLQISRIRTPLGVIGIIYESRPNVTS